MKDSTACYRELAEPASFGYLDNSLEVMRSNGVGPESKDFPPDPRRQLDWVVRFDRLANSPDLSFRKAVEQARGLTTDMWRLNSLAFTISRGGGEEGRMKALAIGGLAYLSGLMREQAIHDAAAGRYLNENGQVVDREGLARVQSNAAAAREEGSAANS